MTHSDYITAMNHGPKFMEQAYNPDEWLRMFRVYGFAPYMRTYLRSLAYWMKVNGRWVLK